MAAVPVLNKAYEGVLTAMSTELNSMASGATVVATTATDNTAVLGLMDDLELSCTYAVAPTVSTTMDVYMIPSIDGTLFADGSSSIAIAKAHYCGGFELRAVATLQVLVLRNVPLSPGKWKYALINNGGQALTASGHTLRRNCHSLTVG